MPQGTFVTSGQGGQKYVEVWSGGQMVSQTPISQPSGTGAGAGGGGGGQAGVTTTPRSYIVGGQTVSKQEFEKTILPSV